jgi:hypothetical protein
MDGGSAENAGAVFGEQATRSFDFLTIHNRRSAMDKKLPFAILLSAIALPATAIAADNYRCTLGDLVRRVEVYYEPGREVPCEVHYYKDTEAPGDRQVPWRAQNEAGYCESRAAAFIEQLKSQGWDCQAGATPPAAAAPAAEAVPAEEPAAAEPPAEEPAETDDTDTLTPADDGN